VDAASAAACLERTAASGVMIGRGAIGRPQVFGEIRVGLGWMEEHDLPWVANDPEAWDAAGEIERAFMTRQWCWSRYIELAEATTGLRAKWMQRHAVAFTKGLPGGRAIRAAMHSQPDEHAFAASVVDFLKGGIAQ
ncbi:MAG: tRNA-dihydrouridine synthase, partial [Candidatus Poseidoniaceae archaeon]